MWFKFCQHRNALHYAFLQHLVALNFWHSHSFPQNWRVFIWLALSDLDNYSDLVISWIHCLETKHYTTRTLSYSKWSQGQNFHWLQCVQDKAINLWKTECPIFKLKHNELNSHGFKDYCILQPAWDSVAGLQTLVKLWCSEGESFSGSSRLYLSGQYTKHTMEVILPWWQTMSLESFKQFLCKQLIRVITFSNLKLCCDIVSGNTWIMLKGFPLLALATLSKQAPV